MFYVLEGADGSGKTSVGKKINELSKVRYIETPIESFKEANKKPDDSDFKKRFDYFMRGNVFTVSQLKPTETYLLGRYYFSTIIAHSMVFDKPLSSIKEMAKKYEIKKPRETFLLVVDEAEQVRRVLDRNKGKHTLEDYKFISDINFRKQLRAYYLSQAENEGWKIIDTTRKSIEDIAREILAEISTPCCLKDYSGFLPDTSVA